MHKVSRNQELPKRKSCQANDCCSKCRKHGHTKCQCTQEKGALDESMMEYTKEGKKVLKVIE